jgi:hypothetical protein
MLNNSDMRNKVRIENFLSKVDIRDLLLNIWNVCDNTNIDQAEKTILDDIDLIKVHWFLYYDLRFSQILINYGYLPNTTGYWYYYEEDEILDRQGWKPRDYVFWGSIYDKQGNKLDEYKYSLVKDLDIDHMQKLIDGNWLRTEFMTKLITDELLRRLRKEKLKIIGKNIKNI